MRRTDLSEGACREPDDQAPAIGIASRESWDGGGRQGLSLLDRIGKRAFPTGAEQGSTQRRVVEDWFHRGGVSPGHAMELGNTEAIKKLVGAGLGLSLGSCFAVRLVARLVHQRGIVLRKDKARTPALTALLDALPGATRAPLTRYTTPPARDPRDGHHPSGPPTIDCRLIVLRALSG